MTDLGREIQNLLAKLPANEQAQVKAKLGRVITHRRALARFRSPADLAKLTRPEFIQTAMLDKLDEALMAAESGAVRRVIVNTPPQEGKTTRLQDACAWMLLRSPWLRIGFASYEQSIAAQSSLEIRRIVETHGGGYRGQVQGIDHVDDLGLLLDPDRAQQTQWSLADVPGKRTRRPGGVVAVGVGSSLTGRPVDVMVVDDPIKDSKQADSPVIRKAIVNWYQSTVLTRLSPTSIVIIVQCMTGDTPVLMADGTEVPLRDVRPGDSIATYEDGHLSASTVRNWANQGPDTIFTIRMKSGTTVRANARHPFLTVKNGVETWQRTDQLEKGAFILKAGEAGGQESHAPKMDAPRSSAVKGSVSATTTSSAGRTDMAAGLRNRVARRISSIGMALSWLNTTSFLKLSGASVRSAVSRQRFAIRGRTGTANCASITTTKPGRFADYSATIATSPWGTASLQQRLSGPLNTYVVTADEVVEIVPAGIEDVFDLQVDRTENFIANGLVSHNTRWHEKDLTGWVLADDAKLPHPRFAHVNIPAQAGKDDILGRAPGEYLISTRGRTAADWEATKASVGTRWWFAMYQGDPSPPEGGTFKRAWFDSRRVHEAPPLQFISTVIDPADNDGNGDEAGIVTGGIDKDGVIYVLADDSGHYTVGGWVRAGLYAMLRHGSSRLMYEQSLSQLRRHIRAEWKSIRQQAVLLRRARLEWAKFGDDTWPEAPENRWLLSVLDELTGDIDTEEEIKERRKQLLDLWPYVPGVLALPPEGPPVKSFPAKGSKSYRAEMASIPYESGRVRHVGFKIELENQMATWQPTQDSPDRMDAVVHLVDQLTKIHTGGGIQNAPAKEGEAPRPQLPARQRQLPQIQRSTRMGR